MASIRINRVYTRSGDAGETGLVGGARIRKTHPRVDAYGEVDELNSWLGMVREQLVGPLAELSPPLEYIQQELFDLGSELATPPGGEYEGMWKAEPHHIAGLEKLCDKYNEGLPELHSFLLPGGSEAVARLHIARTVCRRAERSLVQLSELCAADCIDFNQFVIQYLNRLSDLLFVFARWTLQAEGKTAPQWVPAAKRAAAT